MMIGCQRQTTIPLRKQYHTYTYPIQFPTLRWYLKVTPTDRLTDRPNKVGEREPATNIHTGCHRMIVPGEKNFLKWHFNAFVMWILRNVLWLHLVKMRPAIMFLTQNVGIGTILIITETPFLNHTGTHNQCRFTRIVILIKLKILDLTKLINYCISSFRNFQFPKKKSYYEWHPRTSES